MKESFNPHENQKRRPSNEWIFTRRGMTIVVKDHKDHEQQFANIPETSKIGIIDFNPQGFPHEYSARVLSGINSFNIFFDKINNGEPKPEMLVSDTNVSMAKAARVLGFEVEERSNAEAPVHDLIKYRIVAKTDDVRDAIHHLQEKELRNGESYLETLTKRVKKLDPTITERSLPLTMITALGHNGASAALWLEHMKRSSIVPQKNLIVFGMQTEAEERKPERFHPHKERTKDGE